METGLTVESSARWMRAFAAAIRDHATYLTELDSAIGDADHGINMKRGMDAVEAALEGNDFDDPSALFKKVGLTLVSTVGGASGPLYGTFFLRFGAALQGEGAPFGAALRAGVDGVVERGRAELGDKTMVDALSPASSAFDASAGQGLAAALAAAAAAAAAGRDEVTPLVARRGRASYLGERSAGHQDPGATSATYLVEAAASNLA
jgi:dihydroxyacetone kinase-like protein